MPRMRAEDRRQQLLEVAAELFASRGYRGATTAELARAAGITEPILYRHFENKLDMFVTLIEEVGREVISGWEQALHRNTNDPIGRLRALLAGNPATHKRGRDVYRVIFQAMTEVESDPAIADALRDHLGTLHRFLADELDSLQQEGTIRKDESPATLAWLLIETAIGHGMLNPLGLSNRSVGKGRAHIETLIEDLIVLR